MPSNLINRVAVSALQRLDPETAHNLSISALRFGFVPSTIPVSDPILRTNVWGLDFTNPVGLAAGFDKNGVALAGLRRLGFGFLEVGTVTPLAQSGNPQPRIFRLTQDQAIINRLGFNNNGLAAFVERLQRRESKTKVVVGANVGANKDSKDRVEDYVQGVRACAPFADYLTVNVSSPNTPGLRDLQAIAHLEELLPRVIKAREESGAGDKPVILKIAPDMALEDVEKIGEFVLSHNVDGLIATNTTITRPESLLDPQRGEAGGLSGRPLFDPANKILSQLYKSTRGEIPIVGVGGISSAEDAYTKIKLGASLVQLYSAFIFQGPALIPDLVSSLAKLLREDGYQSVADAVGSGVT